MSELPSHSGLFKRLLFLCSSQILTTAIEPPPPHSYNHHLHILMQLLPLQTTTTQCKLFNSKWSMCASGWKEKDHQRSCNGWHHHQCKTCLCQWLEGKMPPVQFSASDHHHVCKWCCPSINQHKYSSCTHGGGHWLQLVPVAFSFSYWRKHSTGSGATRCNLSWWSFFHPLAHMQCCSCQWWLSVVVIYTYISIYIYIYI